MDAKTLGRRAALGRPGRARAEGTLVAPRPLARPRDPFGMAAPGQVLRDADGLRVGRAAAQPSFPLFLVGLVWGDPIGTIFYIHF